MASLKYKDPVTGEVKRVGIGGGSGGDVDVSGPIAEHNTDPEAHADIRKYVDDQIAGIEVPEVTGGGVNPNLLDNWYFGNPVNQRGLTEYTGTGYGVDRWRTNFSGDTVSVLENGVKNLVTSTSTGWHLYQIITENVSDLVGHEVAASVIVDDLKGSYLIPIISFRNSSAEINSVRANSTARGLVTFSGVIPAGTTELRFGLYAYSGVANGDYVTIRAAKLELGDKQTLAHQDANGNWVLNEIPNYGEELLKCIQSKADSSDTYANKVIATTDKLCNPNLLDNWYFGNPVNQRGQTSYTSAGYGIDRWEANGASLSVNVNTNSVSLSNTSSSTRFLFHWLENVDDLLGKQVTVSALTTDGRLISEAGYFPDSIPSSGSTYTATPYINDAVYIAGVITSGMAACAIRVGTGGSVDLIAVKLELGDTQTLAHKDASGNWVLNEIPNYNEQLLRCIQSKADSADTYANKVIYHSGSSPNDLGVYSVDTMDAIPSNADLNDYTTPGSYRCSSSSIGSTLKNNPMTSASGFTLHVEWVSGGTRGSYLRQHVIANSKYVYDYYRSYQNGTWYDWETNLTTYNGMASITGTYTGGNAGLLVDSGAPDAKFIFISCSNGWAIVGEAGGIVKRSQSTSLEVLNTNKAQFIDGELYAGAADNVINNDGITSYYRVI